MNRNILKRAMGIMLAVMLVTGGVWPALNQAYAMPQVTAEVSPSGLNYSSAKALKYAKDTWNVNPYKVDCINYVRKCNAAGGVTTKSCTIPNYIKYLTEGGFAEYHKLDSREAKVNGKTRYYVKASDNVGKIAPGDTLVYVCDKCGKLWHVGIVAPCNTSGAEAGYFRLYAHNGPIDNKIIARSPHKTCGATTAQVSLYSVHFKSIENGFVNKSGAYTVTVTDDGVNMREGPAATYKAQGVAEKNKDYVIKNVTNNWGQLATNNMWICLDYTKKTSALTVAIDVIASKVNATVSTAQNKVTAAQSTKATVPATNTFTIKMKKTSNARKGPGKAYKKKATVKKGKSYIVSQIKNGWGQLTSNGYWVYLGNANIKSGYQVKITDKDLNLRKGPGKKYKSKGYAKNGTYAVTEISGSWCKLSNGYWVSMKYVKRV